jgi:hypothetical protein
MAKKPQELKDMLREAGREMAVSWLSAACDGASKEVMDNQITLLCNAATHVHATFLYNLVRQSGMTADDALAMLLKELRTELALITAAPDSELEFRKAGDCPASGNTNNAH